MNAMDTQWIFIIVGFGFILGGRAVWRKRLSTLEMDDVDKLLGALQFTSWAGIGGVFAVALLGLLFYRSFPQYQNEISIAAYVLLILELSIVSWKGVSRIKQQQVAPDVAKSYLLSRVLQILGIAVLGLMLAVFRGSGMSS